MTRLISFKDVVGRTSLTRPTLERMVEDNLFPAPIRITPKRLAFDEAAIEAWIRSKIQADVEQAA